MQSIAAFVPPTQDTPPNDAAQHKTNRVRWLKLNFTVKAARLQSLKRQKYQHLQEEALLKARGLLKNWENGVVVLTEDLYRLAAGEREAAELMNYTPEALALRFSLRNDPNVLEAVRQLWQIEMPRDAMGCIDQRGYASVFRRVAKSLDAKAFRRKQKVDRLLDEDWKRDSKGEATMSFANFFDSIFELADLWCETIDAGDYVFFLERLRDRISHVRHGTRSLKLLKKVGAFDADSEDEDEEEEEEEEGDEEDSSEETESAPVVKPPPQVQVARLPVAKSAKPIVQQLPKATTLRKVSRLAMSSSKALPRRQLSTGGKPKPSVATPTMAVPATTAAVPASIDAPPLTASSSMSDVVSPLLPPQSSYLPRGMPPRQRRASVVTTIQFGQDGFVRSRSESIGEDDETVSSIVQQQQAAVSAAIPHAVAAAFAANARRKGSQSSSLRPSLASAAAAALASSRNALSEDTLQSPPSRSIDQVIHPVQEPATEAPATERKRVVTVSTAKYAVLKSIVFATRKAPGRPTREDAPIDTPYPHDAPFEYHTPEQHQPWEPLETPEQVQHLNTISDETSEPVVTYTRESSGQFNERVQETPQLLVPTTATSKPPRGAVGSTTPSGHVISSGVAIRLRSGSIFDIGNKNGTPKPVPSTTANFKGVRLGFGKAGAAALARRDRGGLTPLAVPPGGMGKFAGAVAKTPQTHQYTLTAMPSQGPQGTSVAVVSGPLSSGDVDFSNSFVMTNYVIDRSTLTQSLQGLRTPIVLGANSKEPVLTTTPPTLASSLSSFQGPVVQGTSALAKPLMLQIEQSLPPRDTELPERKPIVVVVDKPQPQPQQQPSPSNPPHRYIGHRLYGPSGHRSNGDTEGTAPSTHEGDPDLALRFKTVLNQDHADVQGKERLMHTVVIGNDRHYEHADQDAVPRDRTPTRGERHGMMIQSLAHRTTSGELSTKVVPRPNRFVDSFATPWDTLENEDDEGSDPSTAASSSRSLLRPENAMETLTRVISKRTASRSAGSFHRDQHGSFYPSPGSPVRRRSYTLATGDSYFDSAIDEYGVDGDSGMPTAHTRARLLTVSSLGGSSVESVQQTVPRRLLQRSRCEEYAEHSDELRESVSAPVLPTITPLELEYSRQQPHTSLSPKQRTRTTSQPPSLTRLRIRRHGRGIEMTVDDLELRGELAMNPSRSPPRAPSVTVQRPSPVKICTCSRRRGPEETGESDSAESHSWPPPVYRLDRADADQEQEDGGDGSESPGKCVACQRQRRDLEATIVLNASRELVLTPQSKEEHVAALIGRDTPSRSEMMRRRHRYTRGKPT